MIKKILKRIKNKELAFCPWLTLLNTGYFTDGVFAMIVSESPRANELAGKPVNQTLVHLESSQLSKFFGATGEPAEFKGSEPAKKSMCLGDRLYLYKSAVNSRRKAWRYDGELMDWLDELFPGNTKLIEGDLLRWMVDGKNVAVLRGIKKPK